MSCTEKCQINSPLSIITIDDKEIKINEMTGIYLNTLLRCNERAEPFKPLMFCKQRQFTQVMNLGNEYYFQKGSHFWRYTDLQFRRNWDQPLIENIRFDSDFSSFLESHGFGIKIII